MNPTANFKIKSFQYAFNGLKEVTGTQVNFKLHILAAVLVMISGFFLKISSADWIMLLFAIGIVTAAECFNTALEYLTNLVSPQHNEIAGKVKDLSAAGVLICSIISATIGVIVFVPRISVLL
ncbi:MAG: diacylglycerol kinase family protein [Bacteroidia bacterium]